MDIAGGRKEIRNQEGIPETEIDVSAWRLTISGMVKKPFTTDFDSLLSMPKALVANTLECSGNSRPLLQQKASGIPKIPAGFGNVTAGSCVFQNTQLPLDLSLCIRHIHDLLMTVY